MPDISTYIEILEDLSITRGETVRDAIIGALREIEEVLNLPSTE